FGGGLPCGVEIAAFDGVRIMVDALRLYPHAQDSYRLKPGLAPKLTVQRPPWCVNANSTSSLQFSNSQLATLALLQGACQTRVEPAAPRRVCERLPIKGKGAPDLVAFDLEIQTLADEAPGVVSLCLVDFFLALLVLEGDQFLGRAAHEGAEHIAR